MIKLIFLFVTTMCYGAELTPYEQMVKDRNVRFELQKQREHEIALEEAKAKILAEARQTTEVNIAIENNNDVDTSSAAYCKTRRSNHKE